MRSKVRAYSHQGHGPRADRQAGYISATSDSTSSLAIGSRSIHLGRLRSILYRAEIGRSGSTADSQGVVRNQGPSRRRERHGTSAIISCCNGITQAYLPKGGLY